MMKNKQNTALKLHGFEFTPTSFSNIFQTCMFLHVLSYKQLADTSIRTMLITNISAIILTSFNF